ncbi:MAG: ABC transporter ATP-binding protein [Alphaproteobacteria bacterium]|nr:ABC transporter ATP-binding protein [Alphaproteobacteria bacterium]
MALLDVADLWAVVEAPTGEAPAVRGVSFALAHGRTLGIVGESGCGKTLTALAIMGLLPRGVHGRGRIGFAGVDLLTQPEDTLCRLRGQRLAMIFQEPMTALNPLHPVGRQVAEPLRIHRGMGQAAAYAQALRLLTEVGLDQSARRMSQFPHELSGGQRQRVMIAMALICGPDLLIADEPTTALDVTVQAHILDLVRALVDERGMALLLISHDLGVVAETVAEVAVMYRGRIVERGPVTAVLGQPAHPYTQGLMQALPRLDARRGERHRVVPGAVPPLGPPEPGCAFAARCALAEPACRTSDPPMAPAGPDHTAACIHIAAARGAWRP